MKKDLLITILYFLVFTTTKAQNVGISNDGSNPDSSAMVDIKSNSKGLLLPRMTKDEKLAISKPANGLFVYQTNDTIGLWYFNENKWEPVQDNLGNRFMNQNLKTNGRYISKEGNNLGILMKDNGAFSIRTRQTSPYTRPDSEIFKMDESGGFYSRGEIGWGSIPTSGEGYRLMWYPYKVAFRAGFAYNEFDDENTGFYSWAGGYLPVAKGIFSFAFGNAVQANGSGSATFGGATAVDGEYSLAAGLRNKILKNYGTAFGYNNKVIGHYGTALGRNTTAGGEGSSTLGTATVAKGFSTTVVGMYNDSLLLGNVEATNIPASNPLFIVGNGSALDNRSNAMVVRKDGTTEVKNLKVQTGLQLGNGSTITKQAGGTVHIGSNTTNFKTVTVNFPVGFATIPMVLATTRAQAGTNYNDTFVVTVSSVTHTSVTFNILRVDANEGWGQQLQLDYMAWSQN